MSEEGAAKKPAGWRVILKEAFQHAIQARLAEAAASMAYYTLFSLFPLLLVLITVESYILDDTIIEQELLTLATEVFPISQELLINNFERLLAIRGQVGSIAIVGLLWSATAAFHTLILNINRAFPEADARGYLRGRFFALVLAGVLSFVLMFVVLASTVLHLFQHHQLPLMGYSIDQISRWANLSRWAPLMIRLATFYSLYAFIPKTQVRNRAALSGALVTVLVSEGVTRAFTIYLSSGVALYSIVYGSLGAIISLMLWMYMSSIVILFGAHISAAINRVMGPRKVPLITLLLTIGQGRQLSSVPAEDRMPIVDSDQEHV
jgi:membrane protein